MARQFSRTAPPAKHTDDQPIAAMSQLPSAVPLMALSTGFWAFKTLAAHEPDLFSRLADGPGMTAGEGVFLPRGVPHQLVNTTGTPCRYLLIGTPALFDRFLEEGGRELQPDEVVGPPTPEEVERLRKASPRFGITLLSDWPPD